MLEERAHIKFMLRASWVSRKHIRKCNHVQNCLAHLRKQSEISKIKQNYKKEKDKIVIILARKELYRKSLGLILGCKYNRRLKVVH